MTRAGTLGPPLCLALAAAALAAAWWAEPFPHRREDVALLMGDDLGPGPPLDDGARRLAESLVDGAERHRFGPSSEFFFGARELGYSGWPHPLLREFDAIRGRPDAGDLLERVVAAGGSAARLYAMALLWDVDRARYERLRPRVAEDPKQVWWSDGCTGHWAAPSAILDQIDRGFSFAP